MLFEMKNARKVIKMMWIMIDTPLRSIPKDPPVNNWVDVVLNDLITKPIFGSPETVVPKIIPSEKFQAACTALQNQMLWVIIRNSDIRMPNKKRPIAAFQSKCGFPMCRKEKKAEFTMIDSNGLFSFKKIPITYPRVNSSSNIACIPNPIRNKRIEVLLDILKMKRIWYPPRKVITPQTTEKRIVPENQPIR